MHSHPRFSRTVYHFLNGFRCSQVGKEFECWARASKGFHDIVFHTHEKDMLRLFPQVAPTSIATSSLPSPPPRLQSHRCPRPLLCLSHADTLPFVVSCAALFRCRRARAVLGDGSVRGSHGHAADVDRPSARGTGGRL